MPPAGDLREQWFRHEKGCSDYVHLECVRAARETDGKFKGSQNLKEAQYQVLGFCDSCFGKMEEARVEAPADAPGTPARPDDDVNVARVPGMPPAE